MKHSRIIKASTLLFIFSFMIFFNIYKCPFKYIFGMSCPICGLTRAFYYALQLNFKLSFHYHLFWPVILIGIIIHVLYELQIIKSNKKQMFIVLYIFAISNLIYFLYRFISGSEIVYFNFSESLLYRVFVFIKTIIK